MQKYSFWVGDLMYASGVCIYVYVAVYGQVEPVCSLHHTECSFKHMQYTFKIYV